MMQLYFILFAMVFTYVCVIDPNVLDWISIKVKHLWTDLQLRYIKLKWMFKKF
jgi:hypothetical protein